MKGSFRDGIGGWKRSFRRLLTSTRGHHGDSETKQFVLQVNGIKKLLRSFHFSKNCFYLSFFVRQRKIVLIREQKMRTSFDSCDIRFFVWEF